MIIGQDFLKAFNTLFQAFFVFDLQYPLELEAFYHFFETIYNFDTSEENLRQCTALHNTLMDFHIPERYFYQYNLSS